MGGKRYARAGLKNVLAPRHVAGVPIALGTTQAYRVRREPFIVPSP